MRIRLGITAPLEIPAPSEGLLALPHLAEWNFVRPDHVRHAVWLESKRPFRRGPTMLVSAAASSGTAHVLRGEIAETEPAGTAVRVERDPAVTRAWTRNARAPEVPIVTQVLEAGALPPERVILVVDGSSGMAPYASEVAESLGRMPASVTARLILALDEPAAPSGAPAEALRAARWRGGMDNVPALQQAWDEAAPHPGSVILWLHAPQPVSLQSAAGLRQRWAHQPGSPRLIAVAAYRGPNRLLEQLDGIGAIETLTRESTLRADLEALFESWGARTPRVRLVRAVVPPRASAPNPTPEGHETSLHLVRLWARDEVARLSAAAATRPQAVQLAVLHQLVTPVSGAVVLENPQQYRDAGLDPAAPQDVPTIPEPEVWALLLVAVAMLAVLAVLARRRRPETPWAA
jgi:hypothetical protein